jgi:hypothetical protein
MQGRRLETTGGVAFSATRPELPRQLLTRREYVEDCFGPRTTQMAADRLPQLNGITRTDSWGGGH